MQRDSVWSRCPLWSTFSAWSVGALFTAFWHSVGNRPAGDFDRVGGAPTIADGAASWFGPLAALVGATMVVIAGLGVRRRTTSAVALGLALAPSIGISILALAVTYDPWRGALPRGSLGDEPGGLGPARTLGGDCRVCRGRDGSNVRAVPGAVPRQAVRHRRRRSDARPRDLEFRAMAGPDLSAGVGPRERRDARRSPGGERSARLRVD